MEVWMKTIYNLAESNESPKLLIERMGKNIRDLYDKDNLLVGKYDAYEQLMNYWAETMQDDVYIIKADGWKTNLRPKMKFDKKQNKEVPIKVNTWMDFESDLVPVDYVVHRFYGDILSECEESAAAISSSQDEIDSLLAEHEDVFDPENFENEKVNLATIKKRAKVVVGEEHAILVEYLDKQDVIKKEKAKLKEAQAKLVSCVKEEYKEQEQNETRVKNLVMGKWIEAISSRIESELSRSVEQFKSQLSAIADRYDQTLDEIDKEVNDYESKVNAHLAQMGFVL